MSRRNSPMTDTVRIFDTTLRDGEQSPGIALNAAEKVEIARQLERLGVDIIEAGFAISSPGEVEGIRAVAHAVDCVVASLARTNDEDIDAAIESLQRREQPSHPRLHRHLRHPPGAQAADVARAGDRVGRPRPWRAPRRSRRTSSSRARTRPAPTSTSWPRWCGWRSRRARPPSTSRTRSATRCRRSTSRSSAACVERVPELDGVIALGALPRRPGAGGRQLAWPA